MRLDIAGSVLGLLVLAACGSSTSSGSGQAPTSQSTVPAIVSTSTSVQPQAFRLEAKRLYREGGANEGEAACLAAIPADATALDDVFDAPTAAETNEAIACVGSEARLRVIAEGLGAWADDHPFG